MDIASRVIQRYLGALRKRVRLRAKTRLFFDKPTKHPTFLILASPVELS